MLPRVGSGIYASHPSHTPQVIQNIGLCICFYDLLWASEGLIGHGTGLVNVNGTLHASHGLTPPANLV